MLVPLKTNFKYINEKFTGLNELKTEAAEGLPHLGPCSLVGAPHPRVALEEAHGSACGPHIPAVLPGPAGSAISP